MIIEDDLRGECLVAGTASGRVLSSDVPLSFWGGVDPVTGMVIDKHHPLQGQDLRGRVLAIPGGRGSCGGSSALFEMVLSGSAPAALVFGRPESILTLGVVIASELFDRRIPVVRLDQPDFERLRSMTSATVVDGIIRPGTDLELSSGLRRGIEDRDVESVTLSELDQAILDGDLGEAAQVAMRIVLRAARLMRLTRAELVVHEEFDWLVQVLLQQDGHRRAIAATMRLVAEAVRDGDADTAWHAGERMVSYVLTELMRARLRMIAERHGGPRGIGRGKRSDLAAEVRSIFDGIVKQLEGMGADVARAFETTPTVRELAAEVAGSVLPRLGKLDDNVYGLGFMAEVDVLAEVAYWMEWWQRAPDGNFDRDYSHQLDATLDDFYDYSVKGYMTQPRATGRPSAMGPYIDHGGVDDSVVTVSVPVSAGGTFVGIMAADIRVAILERSVSPWLARADGVCVLLNAQSRVLVSNSVRYNVGDVLPADADLARTEVGCFDWVIGRADDDD